MLRVVQAVPGYRILSEVASGASGTVYRATQEKLGRVVALKLLAPGLFDAAETRGRFLREAKLQASLSHPNLLGLFDAGFAGQVPYIAMEFAPGGSLRKLLATRGSLEPVEAVLYAAGIAAGLSHAHAAGIVHRDLKPENVLLGEDGSPKVCDFGLAKALSTRQTLETASGVILGTPGYLAPEVLRGEVAGREGDLYALGVTLYEMLAGCRPFGDGEVGDIIRRQLAGRFAALGEARPGLAPGLTLFVARCLESCAAGRPTAEEAAQLLSEFAAGGTPHLASGGTVRLISRSRPAARTTVGMARVAGEGGTAPTARGTARASSLQATAAVRAHPRQESRTGRRVLMLASAVTLAAVGGWFALAPGRLPDRPVVPSLPVKASEARPPGLLAASAGADKVRLYLDRPAAPGTVASIRVAGASGSDSVLQLQPGISDYLITGLRPLTLYEVRLGAARGPGERRISTMDRFSTESAEATVLETVRANALAIGAWGTHVGVCWRYERQNGSETLTYAESADGGVTWLQPEVMVDCPQQISRPALALASSGAMIAWQQPVAGRNRGRVRHRPTMGPGWLDAVDTGPSGDHDPGLEATGATHLLHWDENTPAGVPRMRLMELDASGRRHRDLPGAGELPHDCRQSFCCRLVSIGPRLIAVSLWRAPGRGAVHLQWTELDGQGGAPRTKSISPAALDAGSEFDVGCEGPVVAVTHMVGLDAHVLISRDGGESFSDHTVPFEGSPLTKLQVAAVEVSAGQIVVAVAAPNLLRRHGIAVFRTTGGRDWTPLLTDRVTGIAPRMIRTARVGDRLVVALADNVRGVLAYSLPWR